jgi:hypothetical protein
LISIILRKYLIMVETIERVGMMFDICHDDTVYTPIYHANRCITSSSRACIRAFPRRTGSKSSSSERLFNASYASRYGAINRSKIVCSSCLACQ